MTDVQRRVLISVGAVLAHMVLLRLPLPGVDTEVLSIFLDMAGWMDGGSLSVASIGVTPWLAAMGFVELAALIVPSWRPLRVSGREGRKRLERPIAVLWLVFALIQSFSLAVSMEMMHANGLNLVWQPGFRFRLLAMLTITAGSALVVALYRAAGRHGLGGGLLLAVFVQMVPEIQVWVLGVASSAYPLIAPVLVVIAAVLLVQVRVPGIRLPTPLAGLSPLSNLGTVATFTTSTYLPLVAMTAVYGVLFNRPSEVARFSGIPVAFARRQVFLGIVLQIVIMVGIVYYLLEGRYPTMGFATIVAVAMSWDLAEELQARTQGLTHEAWELHRMYVVPPVVDRLKEDGVIATVVGVRTRSLFHFFGPHLPVRVLVHPDDVSRAEPLIRAFLEERAST